MGKNLCAGKSRLLQSQNTAPVPKTNPEGGICLKAPRAPGPVLSQCHLLQDSNSWVHSGMSYKLVFNPLKLSSFRLPRHNQLTDKDIWIAQMEQGAMLTPSWGWHTPSGALHIVLGSDLYSNCTLILECPVWYRGERCDSKCMVLIIIWDQCDPIMCLESILCDCLHSDKPYLLSILPSSAVIYSIIDNEAFLPTFKF